MRISIHAVTPCSRGEVFDEAEAERASAVLISVKLRDGRLSRFSAIKADDSGSARASARLILYLGLLNLSNRPEKLDEIFVAGRPRQL